MNMHTQPAAGGAVLVRTPRLLVRQFEPGDVDALHALYGNPVVVRWVDTRTPLTREQCERWIEISIANYRTKGYGASAVVESGSSVFVGCCGIVHAPDRDQPEIIYAIVPERWGLGLAGEVVPAMLRYGLEQLGLPCILATIAAENAASRHIVEKAGMVLERVEHHDDGDVMVYAAGSDADGWGGNPHVEP